MTSNNRRRSNRSRTAAIAYAKKQRDAVELLWSIACENWSEAKKSGRDAAAAEIMADAESLRADMDHWNNRVMDAMHGRWVLAHDGIAG